jgi:MBG domain (YGX type)
MEGRKQSSARRRAKFVLVLGVLLCAGVVASGAFGMVAAITGTTESTSTNTTAAATDTTATPTSTDTDTATAATEGTTTTSAPAGNPSISSDAGVYGPGATVKLSGSGWLAGEQVHLFVNDDQGKTWSYSGDVVAGSDGSFTHEIQLPSSFVAVYSVTATGSNGETATTQFQDDAVVVTFPAAATYNAAAWATGCTSSGFCGTANGGNTAAVRLSIRQGNGNYWNGSSFGSASETFSPTTLKSTGGNNYTWSFAFPVTSFPVNGQYTMHVQGLDASGGAIKNDDQTVTFTIQTQQSTSLSVAAASGTYSGTTTLSATLTSGGSGVSGKTISFTLNGNSVGSDTTNSSGTATLSGVGLGGINAGTYGTGVGVSFAGDGSFTSSNGTGSLAIAKANQTIDFGSLGSKTYGDPDFAVGATSSSGLPVSFSALGSCTLVLGHVQLTGAGTCTITASQAGDDNYNAAGAVPQAFTIARATLKLAANDATKVYGAANPSFSGSIQGVVSPDAVTLTLDSPATVTSNVGTYPIVPHATGAADVLANYDVQATRGTLTITTKAITVAADDKTKVYGDADPALTVSVPDGALAQGDSLSGSLERESGNNVGSYAITRGSLTAGGNYDLTVTPGTFTITTKAATLTADDKSKVYGSADPALTTTESGFLADDLGAGKITFSASRAAGESVAGGPYAITPLGSDGATSLLGNYDVTYKTGQLTITKKAATLTADDKSKVYGSADPALTTTDSGFLAADLGAGKITFSASRASGESVAGGPYTITPSASDGATSLLGNYDVTVETGQLTITKKAITVTADDKSKVYGSADPALTVTVPAGALESGDSLSGSLTRESGSNVGSYAITKGSLTAGGDYDLTVTPGTFTITKKAITVKADDKTKVYGSADPALTVTVPAGALESGDSLSGSLVRAAGSNVGSYAITNGSLTAGSNYDLTVTPGTLTITKKAITVAAEDKTKVYGSADPALTVTVPAGALESGDSLSGSLVRAAGNNVGTYAITKGTLTAGANYDLTVTPGTLTITRKPITVTADPQTKVVGASDPALTYKVTSGGLESGDNFSGALTRAPGEAIGTYTITQGTLTAGGNYDLTFVGSTLKIGYRWDGFLQPINDTAHQTGLLESKFKLGQTIPAKFVLKNAAGGVVQQATDPTFSRSGNLGTCDNNAATDTTEVVTPDAGVSYTWDGSQYHYNWSTKNLTAGEYRIYANLADGTKPYVDICLTK